MMLLLHISLAMIAALCVGAWEEGTVVPVRLDPTPPTRTLSGEETREYRLDVFGQELVLRLHPDQTFLAPGFVFHEVGRPGSHPTPGPGSHPTPGPETGADPGCFYSGTVNGDRGSAAALNLCRGLRGGFYLRGSEYFIQPLDSSEEEDVHVIRRRDRAALAEEGGSKCGVNEDEERVPRNLEKDAGRGEGVGAQTGKFG